VVLPEFIKELFVDRLHLLVFVLDLEKFLLEFLDVLMKLLPVELEYCKRLLIAELSMPSRALFPAFS
jgi:hypothetical protein